VGGELTNGSTNIDLYVSDRYASEVSPPSLCLHESGIAAYINKYKNHVPLFYTYKYTCIPLMHLHEFGIAPHINQYKFACY